MSQKQKSIVWTMVLVVVVLLGTLAFVVGRPRRIANERNPTIPVRETQFVQSGAAKDETPRPRNLSLQPEAFNMALRLGQRFSPATREKSILGGTVTIGSERRTVETTRTQTEKGERVEIATTTGSLTWEAGQGAFSSGSRATGNDRDLVERLVLDSPDQFVLAQLRGASYYTVARNVRPDKSSDDYLGPLWNIVRVDDPEGDEMKRPQSRWRLYYLNAATGLIDRIVSDVEGQRIIAEFTWTEILGEKVPAQITWTRQGRTLMQYQLTTFAHGQEGGV